MKHRKTPRIATPGARTPSPVVRRMAAGSATPRGLWFLALLMFLAPATYGSVGHGRSHEPLAVRVQQILGMKIGTHPYLPAYLAVMRWVHSVNQRRLPSSPRQPIRPSPAVRLAVASLVRAINAGADATALRDRILRSLTVDGFYKEKPPWVYGTGLDPISLAYGMQRRAALLFKAGKKALAIRYARASLVLFCQYDMFWDAGFLLAAWRSPTRETLALLGITVAQQARLQEIFRHSAHIESRWLHSAFLGDYDTVLKAGRGVLPQNFSQRCAADLALVIRQASGRINEEYRLVVAALHLRRQLQLRGHHGLSKKLKVVLQQWAAQVKANHTMPKLEKAALLRWIKEASS